MADIKEENVVIRDEIEIELASEVDFDDDVFVFLVDSPSVLQFRGLILGTELLSARLP
jgi:hypothetical protein